MFPWDNGHQKHLAGILGDGDKGANKLQIWERLEVIPILLLVLLPLNTLKLKEEIFEKNDAEMTTLISIIFF